MNGFRVADLILRLVPDRESFKGTLRFVKWWPWRTKPVMLTETCEPKDVADSFKVWNPKTNSADRAHVMPVITPAYPAMNSTHNVTETTMRILLEEFSRGHEMVRWIEEGCKRWSDMYAPFPYFERSRHFLHLEILA